METISSVDRALDDVLQNLNVVAKDLCFETFGELPKSGLFKGPEYSGLYLIEIKNDQVHADFEAWINWFTAVWERNEYVDKWTPNTKQKRIRCHTELLDWMPLYLGKARKIGPRVQQHLSKGLDKKTAALKLFARTNLVNQTFRLKTMRIEVTNYDVIMPHLENRLRDLINPILGKQ